MKASRWLALAFVVTSVAGCAGGPVRRVSEPSARIQQITVQADGSWQTQLRIENFSSIPMRFDSLDVALSVAGEPAGRLTAQPAITIGPESADVVSTTFAPSVAAKLAAADALASGRSLDYSLAGTVMATPDEKRQRSFEIKRSSALSPAPGLPGVLR
ncbi:LEA type 2 family protein [Lysobacter korlensis]|uniref:LEA type 2 family protein n=1 Tax=Lysobacter korlensis TaxID=553636 RepID=A0ABV6RSP9_9GAMM